MKTGIYIVATPIGNLGDISQRALDVLNNADVVACEDTRITKKLFSLLGISLQKIFIKLEDHSEERQSEKIIDYVKEGKIVAQVSDAGSPLISDPGYRLVRKCKENNIEIWTIPGACALICALQLSGLPTNSFMFAGFIPNKEKARKDFLKKYEKLDTTLVFYETAARIQKTLSVAKDIYQDREFVVARELTKIYEECISGNAESLIAHFEKNEPKGEMVFMVGPLKEKNLMQIDVYAILKQKMRSCSLKDAVKETCEEYNLSKNDVYKIALSIKDEKL